MDNQLVKNQTISGCQISYPLTKASNKYKLIVSSFLEAKIRYLCDKFPGNEWSGVMFYDTAGNFEDETLKVICKDFCLMDIGTSGWTEYDINAEVAQYMAMNDLVDYKHAIIHSHNRMATFFSGTDINTLRQEGNKRDVFVSLIVNNDGKYNAAITNQVDRDMECDITDTYKGFGSTFSQKSNETITNKHVEYCFFNEIEIEPAEELSEDILGELNERIDVLKSRQPVRSYHNYSRHDDYSYLNFQDSYLDINDYMPLGAHEGYLWEDMELVAEVEREGYKYGKKETIRIIAQELIGRLLTGKLYIPIKISEIKKSHITMFSKSFNWDIYTLRSLLDSVSSTIFDDDFIRFVCKNMNIAYDISIPCKMYAIEALNMLKSFLKKYTDSKTKRKTLLQDIEDETTEVTKILINHIESYT